MSAPTAAERQQNGQQEASEPSLLEQVIINTRPDDRPQTLESEQLQIQVVTAKKYPRSVRQFLAEAKGMATINQETAASCFYSVPRAGKTISGPSVRLAEICMSCWGHLDCGTRVKEIGETFILVEGFAWDMQKNTKARQEVRRNIVNRQGKRYGEDMISNTVNAGASIAFRNAIFRIIPRAYVDQLWHEARMVACGDAKTLSATRDTAITYFTKMGVLVERIFMALDVQGVEDLTIDHVGILKGYATAIKDGEATLEECFPPTGREAPAGKQTKTQALAEKLGAPKPEPTPKAPEPPAAQAPPATPPQPEQSDEDAMAQRDAIDEARDKMRGAATDRELSDVCAWMVRNQAVLGDAYDGLVGELKARTGEVAAGRPAAAGKGKGKERTF